jgi:hypothetical protein
MISTHEPDCDDEEISDVWPRFPEKVEYVISPEAASQAIADALKKIEGFRDKDLHIIRDVVRPLAPEFLRNVLEAKLLERLTFSYQAIINFGGYLTGMLTMVGLHAKLDPINHYYRLAVLPFIDLRLREKIDKLNQEKPFAWKLWRWLYGLVLHSIERVVDNLINLVVLGWVFCPGIGEPDKATGFYNRFVFGARCGFLDLGHFFNCALISYLYGRDEAKQRAESVEVSQRKFRQKEWLQWMRQHKILAPLAELFWGYAMSADTIEDRSSDWFGIELGEKIRAYKNNGKIIEFFIAKWPQLVKGDLLGPAKESMLRKIWTAIKLMAQVIRYRLGTGGRFDLVEEMKIFFTKHGALDPADASAVPAGLLAETIQFYMAKYGGEEWHRFTSRGWDVVIPQKLWEHVVRDKFAKNGEKLEDAVLPIKIQLDNGEKVSPYFREE